ncbi:MAG TPA: hypothetical protein VI669_17965 [Vicinamibacteria bacterium]
MPSTRSADLLRLLATGEVQFIVVGMTAGILHGAPVSTIDLDIVHRRSPENIARLLEVLGGLDAVARHDPRRLRPQESHLAGDGHILLTTTHGDLDCLGSIDDGKGYEDLLEHAVQMTLGDGLAIHVLGLRSLIGIKERAGRPKDLAAIPVLRATLDEIERRS